jgi:hypothetical protein
LSLATGCRISKKFPVAAEFPAWETGANFYICENGANCRVPAAPLQFLALTSLSPGLN